MSVPNPATTDWVPIFAGGNPLAYRADWAAGTTYVDGDIVVKDGIAYLCAGGPTSVAPDIAPWGGAIANRPPGELAYGQIVGNVTANATTEATATPIVTAPPVTLDGVTPIVIEWFLPAPAFGDTPQADVYLFDGSTSLGEVWRIDGSRVVINTFLGHNITGRVRITPAAGTHTFSIRGRVSSGSGLIIYAGVGAAGTWTPAHIRVTQANPYMLAPAGPTVLTYGTSLPTSPADGQEHVLVDSLTNPSYQWRFRYNAGSVSAYKWEFVGGAPAQSYVPTAQNTTSAASYVDLATVGPSIVVPRAGDYEIMASALANHTVVGTYLYIAIAKGAGTAIAQTQATITRVAPDWFPHQTLHSRVVALAANDEARLRYYMSGAGTGAWFERWLTVTPIRVA